MRLLIVGSGATGGFFGARLLQAGRDVTFLLRAGRAAQIRTHGLTVKTPHETFQLSPPVLTRDELTTPFDVILLTVKAPALEQALDDIAPAVGPQTLLLSTLNGIRHLDRMASRFGAERVAGCVCKINATIDEQGAIVQFDDINDLTYGELDGTRSTRIERVHALFAEAGFDARLSADIRTVLWEKWTFLSCLGMINCLGRGTIGEVVAAPGGLSLIEALMTEVIATVRASGGTLSEAYLGMIRKRLTDPASRQTSSMYRDLSNGNPVEADQIVGDLVNRARSANLTTPLLDAAYTQLCVYSNRQHTR